ncbi:MAG: hypothetical protein JJ975_11930 [Bacteroidia bacterium]|nr:hypothetical protein [Bacteroidia bacterium]
MRQFITRKRTLLLIAIVTMFVSCGKDEPISKEGGYVDVVYAGRNICQLTQHSSVVNIELDNSQMVLHNFFELVDSGSIEHNQKIKIRFRDVDSTMFKSGVLCGMAIVAPVAELTDVKLD